MATGPIDGINPVASSGRSATRRQALIGCLTGALALLLLGSRELPDWLTHHWPASQVLGSRLDHVLEELGFTAPYDWLHAAVRRLTPDI